MANDFVSPSVIPVTSIVIKGIVTDSRKYVNKTTQVNQGILIIKTEDGKELKFFDAPLGLVDSLSFGVSVDITISKNK